jgi:hypothetical protein
MERGGYPVVAHGSWIIVSWQQPQQELMEPPASAAPAAGTGVQQKRSCHSRWCGQRPEDAACAATAAAAGVQVESLRLQLKQQKVLGSVNGLLAWQTCLG